MPIARSCPKCRVALHSIQVKDSPVVLDQCAKCQGLWLDEGELQRLVKHRAKLAPLLSQGLERAERAGEHCPACRRDSLFTGCIPGMSAIEIQSCASCRGIWLDHGELHAIARECLEPVASPTSSGKPKVVALHELTGADAGRARPGGSDGLPPQFEAVLDDGEEVLWSGQPLYLPFVLGGVPLLLLGLFILVFGGSAMTVGKQGDLLSLLLPRIGKSFPFWIAVANLLRLHLVHHNTWYAATNRRLLLRTGFFGTDFKTYDYDKIADLEVNVNILERLFACGSIVINTMGTPVFDRRGRPYMPWYNRFISIADPYAVFKLIKGVQFDVKTDIEYPNAKRPSHNPGYKTKLG